MQPSDRKRRTASRVTICVALGFGLFLGACSDDAAAPGDDGGKTSGLSDGRFDAIDGMQVRSSHQPLISEDLGFISAAESRLVGDCMDDQGFAYPVLSVDDNVPSPPDYLSPTELRRSGYQYDWVRAAEVFLEYNYEDARGDPTVGMSDQEAGQFNVALLGSDDAEQVTLQDGDGGSMAVSTEGCLAVAREELYGSVANSIRLSRAIEGLSEGDLRQELQRSPEYGPPLEAWQECMRRAGHAVSDDTDYGATWLQAQGASALSEQGGRQTLVTADVIESVANADADCQESSGLHEVREKLLPAAEDAIASKLGFEMSQYVAFQHAVLQRAKRVP